MNKNVFSVKLSTGAREVDIHVAFGEGLAIVGLNDSGKSEILKNIAKKGKGVTYRGVGGALQKSEQDLFNLEVGYAKIDKRLRSELVKNVLQRASAYYEMLAGEVAGIIDLPEKYWTKAVGALPLFLQNRLALIDAMSAGHTVILIDDVFGLDQKLKDKITAFLVKAGKKPLTYIIATVDLAFANLCAKTVIIDDGRAVEWGKTSRVLKAPAHPYSAWLVDLSKKGKSGIAWHKSVGKPKKRACKYATVCPFADGRCYRESPLFSPYTTSEYTSCFRVEMGKN